VGYKAMAVNLSDIAAMAGIPRAAVVAVALPRNNAVEVAHGLHSGMRALADRFAVDLVGGDTNAWDGPLVITVTVLGQATVRGAARGRSAGRRDPGDRSARRQPGLRPASEARAADRRGPGHPPRRAHPRHDRPLRRAFLRPRPYPRRERWAGGDPRRRRHPDP